MTKPLLACGRSPGSGIKGRADEHGGENSHQSAMLQTRGAVRFQRVRSFRTNIRSRNRLALTA